MGRKISASVSGKVKVEDAGGRLRLRWTHGQRYCLSVGLPVSKANITIAIAQANRIESEIIHHVFDPTLARYQPLTVETKTQVSLSRAFERF